MVLEYRSAGHRVRCRWCAVFLCIVFTVCGVIYLGYFCPEKVCALTSARGLTAPQQQLQQQQRLSLAGTLPRHRDSSHSSNTNKRTRPGVVLVTNTDNNNAVDSDYADDAPFDDGLAGRTNNFLDLLPGDEDDEDAAPIRLLVPAAHSRRPIQVEADRQQLPPMTEAQMDGLRFPVKTVGVSFDQIVAGLNASGGSNNGGRFSFDIGGGDVMVFLHIQKTGGTTFGRHLVHDLDLDKPCECRRRGKTKRKRCKCVRPNSDSSYWLFSRFSTGWQCGLHADWTELTGCVDHVLSREERGHRQRRYFYITLLRDPVTRFLSEFLHVQRGATWKTARHVCGGREASVAELPACYAGATWEDVSLDEFMSCTSNLAANRQTRMLADLTLVGCYNASALPRRRREALMLASAKENLRRLAHFGLCEHQQVTQYMFEETFRMNFLAGFQQFNETHVTSVFRDVTADQLRRAREINSLDVQLYEYARELLAERFERLKRMDSDFEGHYRGLARPPTKNFQGGEESDSN